MVAVQIVGRRTEFVPLVVAGFMLGYVIRRDASHRVFGLVVAAAVLTWLGEPAGTLPSVLLLFGGVLALATAAGLQYVESETPAD
jgi:hypothetical protein